MSDYIVGLLGTGTWELIFTTCFFFGLLFFIFVIVGAFGHDGHDAAHHDAHLDTDAMDSDAILHGVGIDIDGDGIVDGLDLTGDGVIDVHGGGFHVDGIHADASHLDAAHVDPSGHLDAAHLDGHDLSIDHLSVDSNFGTDAAYKEFKSKYLIGNITVFMYLFGLIGWMNLQNLRDSHLIIAVVTGLIGAKFFAWIIANFAKTVIVPVINIRKGDIGVVVYGVTPDKPGMVQVKRRDGMVSTIMAKGAFPHDYFDKNERGYIWGIDNEIYLITRGVAGQPDLNPQHIEKKTKKALDLQ